MIAVCCKPRVLADHRGQLESVEFGHRDVDEDDRNVLTQQLLQRLPSRSRLDQIFAELLQDHFIAEQLRRLIVDQQDVHWIADCAALRPGLTDAARCEAPKAVVPC